MYGQFKFEMVLRVLLLAGGLNWLTAAFLKKDVIGMAFEALKVPIIARIVYGLVGFSAVYLMFSRDYYLPFLSATAFPHPALKVQEPEKATVMLRVKVNAPAGTKVVYWASEPAKEVVASPRQAYQGGKNSGVVLVDANMEVAFKVRDPSEYRVGMFGRKVPKHIHYRVESGSGMLGPVLTAYL